MGDGQKLKEILDKQGKSVRWVAKETTISPTTLYSIIPEGHIYQIRFCASYCQCSWN